MTDGVNRDRARYRTRRQVDSSEGTAEGKSGRTKRQSDLCLANQFAYVQLNKVFEKIQTLTRRAVHLYKAPTLTPHAINPRCFRSETCQQLINSPGSRGTTVVCYPSL